MVFFCIYLRSSPINHVNTLKICCPKELESVFNELTIPNKPNFIVHATIVRRNRQSGNTSHLNRNLCYVEIYWAAQNIAFPEGNKLFAGDFRAKLYEKNCYGSIYKDMELEMDFLTSRILLQKVCCYKYEFCTKAK